MQSVFAQFTDTVTEVLLSCSLAMKTLACAVAETLFPVEFPQVTTSVRALPRVLSSLRFPVSRTPPARAPSITATSRGEGSLARRSVETSNSLEARYISTAACSAAIVSTALISTSSRERFGGAAGGGAEDPEVMAARDGSLCLLHLAWAQDIWPVIDKR